MASALLAAGPALAETRALLVGVSDYEAEVAGLADLRGPVNDVHLLRDVLADRGVSDIRVLADGIEGAGRPSRAAILEALAALAHDATEGDFVYLHFSGHGTRQLDPEGDETDGLDEVFLAIDTGRAPPGSGLIPNAIVDDEIGAAVAAIRAKAADVWLVLDSCHSGSGLRGADEGTAARFVEPAALGVAIDAAQPPVESLEGGAVPDLPGGYLAFYAAKSSEVAREVNMAGPSGGETWYGLFSAKLAARLADDTPLSFRQLFQAVISDLDDTSLPGVARLQTPSWEGNLIDAAVFGGRATSGLRRFRVEGDEIRAGLVHGLAEGTLVGLVSDAAAPPDAIIGYAQVELVEATRGFLRPVAEDCAPRSSAPCPAAGELAEGAAFAQVVARPLDLVTRLSPPADAATGTPLPEDAGASRALREAIAEASSAGYTLLVDPGAYDVQTLWTEGRLWFGPRAAIGDSPVGLAWDPGAAQPLMPLLVRIAQAETLARTLAEVAGDANPLNPSPISVSARIRAVHAEDLAAPGSDISPVRECRRAHAAADLQDGVLAPGADLKQCDTLSFGAQGTTLGARDVNRVYIDSHFCIRVDHELIEDNRAARRLGPDLTLCSECPDGYAAGEERMFVVVTEAEDNAEPLNLEGLLDNCSGGGGTRGASGDAALAFLAERARRPGMRGSFGGFATSSIWVESYSWRVLPRAEALKRATGPAGDGGG